MAEILINDIEPIDGYTAAGGETGYDYNFPIFDEDDLVVLEITDAGVVSTLVKGTDYTVSGVGVATGGSITFDLTAYPSGAPADYRYVLYRDLAVSRGTDFLTGGDFKAATVNRELDKIIMMIQQNELEIKRGLGLQKADAEDEINFEIETAADRTDKVLIFGASGNTVKAGPTSGDISTVAASIANVNLVGADIANVNTVAGAIANVNTVAGSISNVNTVAGSIANVNSVAGNATNINTVATDLTGDDDIGTVATNISDVNTIVTNIADVNTVATDLGGTDTIGTVAGAIANVNTVASNISGVNSFAERYRVAASDPATSLDEGDLVFNTTSNLLKYYNGTSWQSIAPGIGAVADDSTPQLGGMLDVNGNAIGDGTRELLTFTEDASAVNHVNIENEATGSGPIINAAGDDTNIDLLLRPKGTGVLDLDGLKWPSADGTSGQVVQTDGSGNLSFADAGGGADSGGMATNRYYVGYGRKPVAGSTIFANNIYIHPFEITETTTVNRAGINITSAAAGNGRFGIYTMSGGVPVALVVDCGTISTGSTGLTEVTFSQELAPGWYCLVFLCDTNFSASITQIDTNTVHPHVVGMPAYNGSYINQLIYSYSYAAFPSSFPGSPTYTDNNGVYSWLRKV